MQPVTEAEIYHSMVFSWPVCLMFFGAMSVICSQQPSVRTQCLDSTQCYNTQREALCVCCQETGSLLWRMDDHH